MLTRVFLACRKDESVDAAGIYFLKLHGKPDLKHSSHQLLLYASRFEAECSIKFFEPREVDIARDLQESNFSLCQGCTVVTGCPHSKLYI